MAKYPIYERKAKIAKNNLGMISTASEIATRAGVKMLEKGGNAVDAAVAAAFCLGVTEPQASGLGGQSMALLHMANDTRTIAVDGSSRAPFAIDPENIPQDLLKVGITATTVPSTPAVLGYLLEKYGCLKLHEVLEPAITAAAEGFQLTVLQHGLIKRESKKMMHDRFVVQNFFKDNQPLQSGEILRQPELAFCLQRLADAGWKDFYLGEIAEEIVKDTEARGGFITKVDLHQIPLPIERPVLNGSYRSYNLSTFPPPGAGRVLIEILNILENFSPDELEPDNFLFPLILALTFRTAIRDRERMPVNPEFYFQLPNKFMIDKDYAQRIAQRIHSLSLFARSENYPAVETAGETTHLSAADAEGNAVGITQSIELVFGAKRMAENLGFFYNCYMSAFDYKDITHPFYLLPGGRPWSSVAPTLIFEGEKPRLMLGNPGSDRIATSLAQVISRVLDAGQDLAAAVAAPRLHVTGKGKAIIEERFRPEIKELLSRTGFEVKKQGAYSFYMGCLQAVMLPGPDEKEFYGVSDPRRDGTALGPRIKRGRENENSNYLQP